MEGATPNVTMSAKLSKSLPTLEETFNNLATKPSKKSGIVAKAINVDAHKSS